MTLSEKSLAIKTDSQPETRREKVTQVEKFHRLVACLHGAKVQNFTGYIKVNYSHGCIGRVERFEEILKK